jgi:eukaryotic-like serine/threonine-protein kinase
MFATAIQPGRPFPGEGRTSLLKESYRSKSRDNSVLISTDGNLYHLENILGRGGLSVVWRATRFTDGLQVAVKIASPHKAEEAGDLLCREAGLMAQLDHPNIVKLLDRGLTNDGNPFLVMELLAGQTLEQVLVAQTSLAPARATALCLQIASAVQYAHEKGILHRDIKPGNIILVERDGVETAVIYDFGISLTVGEDGTFYDNTSSGSLLYASPEQLSEERCTYNTDVYQLAMVMFETLTGRLPFEISIAGAVNYRRSTGPVLLSDDELGEKRLSRAMRSILSEALARDPQRRTGNMHIFKENIESTLDKTDSYDFSPAAA